MNLSAYYTAHASFGVSACRCLNACVLRNTRFLVTLFNVNIINSVAH